MVKIRNNQAGIAHIAVIVLVVLALVGLAGWKVWDSNKRTANTNDTNIAPTETTTQEAEDKTAEDTPKEDRKTLVSSKGFIVTYSSLPDGWKISDECDEGSTSTKALLPPNKESIRCQSEDWGAVNVSIRDAETEEAIKDCSGEESERQESAQYEEYVSYDCEVLTVDGKKGTKETRVSNENAAFTGGDTYTDYSFYLSDDVVVKVTFTNATSAGKPEYTSQLDDFVKTLAFK